MRKPPRKIDRAEAARSLIELQKLFRKKPAEKQSAPVARSASEAKLKTDCNEVAK